MMGIVNGVVTGIVTAVERREAPGVPVDQGRVKVTFQWLDESHETDWIRIAWPMAGKARGMMFMPHVDDEVLLAFDHGDINHPYVIGFLHNGVDVQPSDHIQKRVIKTDRNHQIIFLDAAPDSPSAGSLIIRDGNGNTIVMTNGKILLQGTIIEIEANTIFLQGRRPPTPGSEPPWRRKISQNNSSI